MDPLLSVAIVTHDGRRHLARLLDSLRRQEGGLGDVEVLVVDNASRDGTIRWLARAFPEGRVIVNDSNRGFAGPCNQAADAARGAWLAFVNNDAVLDPGWLSAMRARAHSGAADAYSGKILSRDGRRVLFAGGGLNFYGAGFQAGYGVPVEAWRDGPEDLLFPCGAAMIVRRDVFLDAGGFDPDYFAYYEDVDLGWRLRLFGRRILYAPEAVARHVHQGTSRRFPSAKTFFHCERNVLLTLVKNLSEENLYRLLCASLLFTVRRGTMSYPLPVPDFSFPQEMLPAVRRPVRTPRALMRKLLHFFRRPFSTPYAESLTRPMALDALLAEAPAVWEKRRRVQARRKVPDEEIFPLFRQPLYTPWEEPSYTALQARLFRAWGIDRLFEPRGEAARA